MTNVEKLYTAQDAVLARVFSLDLPELSGIILGGGTAMARYYLHHRVSYDLDFFVPTRFDPERLAVRLGARGLRLEQIQMESEKFVSQLLGYTTIDGSEVKISFVEDGYAGMFEQAYFGKVATEVVDGLYHRKLRTISGIAMGVDADAVISGRQAARDLFDIMVLSERVEPVASFIKRINEQGANFPVQAFERGLQAIGWHRLLDEFEHIETLPPWENVSLMAQVKDAMSVQLERLLGNGSKFKI